MKKFLLRLFKFLLIGILPIALLFIGYLYNDPFKVLKPYSDYSNMNVVSNRDYISTEMFIKNNPTHHYNSFILGSSRTCGFKPEKWKTFLDDTSTAKPFMFDASGESIYGIYTKLKYLDSLHVNIKNVLIILCRDVSFANRQNHIGHLFIKHPATSGENNFTFQFSFFKAYLNPRFLFNFYYYKITNKYKPFMKGYIEDRKIIIDTTTNALNIVDQEYEIRNKTAAYYEARKNIFYNRKGETVDSIARIDSKHLFMLNEIKRLLEKNNCHYKLVLSPLYEQMKFNPKDYTILKNIFSTNLYDFTGKNYFSDSINHFYEVSHFRPIVGDSILSIIYKK